MMDADLAEHLEAAHAGHLDVEKHEVERLSIDLRERLGAVGGNRDEVALLTEPPGERVSIVVVVVDDQQRALSCHWLASPRRRGREGGTVELASSEAILSISGSKRTGLVSKSSPPAARARSRSLVMAWALSTMMGMCCVNASALSRRVASHPSITGSPRSIRMRSGLADCATETACWPSTATTTSYPRRCSRRASASRLASLSSTTRIVAIEFRSLRPGATMRRRPTCSSPRRQAPATPLRPRSFRAAGVRRTATLHRDGSR